MTTSPRVNFTELVAGQAVPETTVNEMGLRLEQGATHFIFKDRGLATPPGSPAQGDSYLVPGSPTGAWTGHTGDIAFYMNTAWEFIEAIEGMTAWVNDEDSLVAYDGASWNVVVAGSSGVNIQSVVSSATVTPTFSDDQVNITAQAANLTLANPTGTAVDGWGISIRIKDNATPRTISYGTQYRAVGVTLPTTTIASKTLYLGMIFNNADTKWDVVSVQQEA